MFCFLHFEETKYLFKILQQEDIEARFVGGVVRDFISGERKENPDLDIAVKCNIQKVEQCLISNGVHCFSHNINYGTITAFIQNKKFELTELRRDISCSGRACQKEYTNSFEEDAKRRDFTINALYVNSSGELFDYFNGIKDLQNKNISFIGDPQTRIHEDFLRILRYYRFCSKFGDFSNKYKDIIILNTKHLKILSIERLQYELFLILNSKYYAEILLLMNDTGIFNYIFSDINLNILPKIQNISLEAKLYLLFPNTIFDKNFKLTKSQQKTIARYKNFENENLSYCCIKCEPKFLLDLLGIKYIKNKIPIFPVQFIDLQNAIINPNEKLKLCEKWWASNNFQKSLQDCLEFIKNLKN